MRIEEVHSMPLHVFLECKSRDIWESKPRSNLGPHDSIFYFAQTNGACNFSRLLISGIKVYDSRGPCDVEKSNHVCGGQQWGVRGLCMSQVAPCRASVCRDTQIRPGAVVKLILRTQ